MQLPLFFASSNQTGRKGVSVRIFPGLWIIDWDCEHTKCSLSINDSEFQEIPNLHKFQIDKESNITLKIIYAGSNKSLTSFVRRVC